MSHGCLSSFITIMALSLFDKYHESYQGRICQNWKSHLRKSKGSWVDWLFLNGLSNLVIFFVCLAFLYYSINTRFHFKPLKLSQGVGNWVQYVPNFSLWKVLVFFSSSYYFVFDPDIIIFVINLNIGEVTMRLR